MMRGRVLSVAVLFGLVTAACGGSSGGDTPTPAPTKLTVLAAASLTNVFPKIGADFTKSHPGVTFTFSFAGTDQLAAQVEQGAPADVFAGASTRYGDQLAGEHLIGATTLFCTNQLVVITPASNPGGITTLQDLATKPVKIVIGAEAVPVGAYTRTVLTNLDSVYGAGYSDKVLANVVSNEDSVTSIVTKVQSGEADAGFVYITDALAAGQDVNTIKLPDEAQAVAQYPIAAVTASTHKADAEAFAGFVLTPPAQQLLQQAGFGPPPSSASS
jgi:molybdate transport system substrate-binding protein